MGTIGTAVAQEAADVALLRDDWRQVPEAIQLGRRTARTIRQNTWALPCWSWGWLRLG